MSGALGIKTGHYRSLCLIVPWWPGGWFRPCGIVGPRPGARREGSIPHRAYWGRVVVAILREGVVN